MTCGLLSFIQLPHFEPMLAIFQLSAKRLSETFSQVKAKRLFEPRHHQWRLIFLGPRRAIEITPDLHYHFLVSVNHGLLYNPVNQELKVCFLLALGNLM